MNLHRLAEEAAELLKTASRRLVLAESCTAGRIAATLGLVPGISDVLCGSAVVYRPQTKIAWLGVSPDRLAQFSAESEEITMDITRGVLAQTPEADTALGITGHLGPDAPVNDGLIFLALTATNKSAVSTHHQLGSTKRGERQEEAAAAAIAFLLDTLRRP